MLMFMWSGVGLSYLWDSFEIPREGVNIEAKLLTYDQLSRIRFHQLSPRVLGASTVRLLKVFWTNSS